MRRMQPSANMRPGPDRGSAHRPTLQMQRRPPHASGPRACTHDAPASPQTAPTYRSVTADGADLPQRMYSACPGLSGRSTKSRNAKA